MGKGDRVALAKLAVDHFDKHQRPLRIAIDAAIWNFQTQSGQGGKNPALRTLFFRLLKLLALPINPIFVYDGKDKPLTKRGRTVSRYGVCVPNELSKNLVARFQFPYHTAPGEAEAECAFLQSHGIVDAVMSQDVDAIMFGSTVTLRDWSKEGSKGNKAPTHVNMLEQARIKDVTGLDPAGMILVALLSGGDYHDGLPGFGSGLSCQIARAGFAEELVAIVRSGDEQGLTEWRERLRYELETNESGYFLRRNSKVTIPEDFPDRTVMGYYLNPAVSKQEDLKILEARWLQWWNKKIDVAALREYTAMTFDWLYRAGAKRYVRCIAQPLFQHQLITKQLCVSNLSTSDITGRRTHFATGGIPELRFTAIPAEVVGIDFDAEEENPEHVLEEDEDLEAIVPIAPEASGDASERSSGPSQQRDPSKWDPFSPERWWVPEEFLRMGLPDVVEAWHQGQLRKQADSAKPDTQKNNPRANVNKARKIDKSMKQGATEHLLPEIGLEQTKPPPRTRKPLERAKTDTTLLRTSQKIGIDSFFKSAKSSEAKCTRMDSEKIRMRGFETVADDECQDELEVDILDLVSQASRPTLPWFVHSKDKSDVCDAAKSPTITHRKTKKKQSPKLSIPQDDAEVVFVGSKKLPPPISSFFGPDSKSKLHHAPRDPEVFAGERLDNRHSRTRHEKQRGVLFRREVLSTAPDSEQSIGQTRQPNTTAYGFEHLRGEPGTAPSKALSGEFQELLATKYTKGLAVGRESLPGTWKEAPSTPSQTAGIPIIDLTNT